MRRLPRRRFRMSTRPTAPESAFARLIGLTEAAYGLPAGQILSDSRDTRTTEARAVAAYLAHTSWGWPQRQVAVALGRTSHAPINRAIASVEEARDSARFDRRVSALETLIRGMTAPEISEEHPFGGASG